MEGQSQGKKQKGKKGKGQPQGQEQPQPIAAAVVVEMGETSENIPPPPKTPDAEQNSAENENESELLLLGSREAERNLLTLLNKRFEKIIEKNRKLQQANNQLMTQLDIEKKDSSAKVTEVTTRVNGELQKLRDELGNVKKEMTVMTFTLGTTRKENQDLRERLDKVTDENDGQKNQIMSLENELDTLNTKLRRETETKNKLERDLKDWKDEAIKLGAVLQDTKTELEKEILEKLELEKELREQIDEKTLKITEFESNMFKLQAASKQLLHDQNEKQQKEFESILEQNMSNLREEYSRKLLENKEEQSLLYQAKEQEHISKEDSLTTTLKKKEAELEKAQKDAKALTEAVRKLEAERHALLIQLDDLESEKKAEKARLQDEIQERDLLLKKKIQEQNELLSRCQNLLDVKVALDNELAAYKALLETEESRLQIGEFGKQDENGNFTNQQSQHV